MHFTFHWTFLDTNDRPFDAEFNTAEEAMYYAEGHFMDREYYPRTIDLVRIATDNDGNQSIASIGTWRTEYDYTSNEEHRTW